MGAVLVCFGDHEPDFSEIRQRRERTPSEDSLLDRLQKTWSCGRLEDEDEDPAKCVRWDAFLLQSNRSTASSGSRMLSAFYSRVLEENDDCAFYVDGRGKRVKGAYLDRVELLDAYFLPSGRRRDLSTASPLAEALEMYSSSEDCFSTSSTMVSELDYWAGSSDASEERRLDARFLPPRPVFGRCSSLGSPVHAGLKIHRALTSPYQQEDACIARFQSPWSSPRAKLGGSRQFPSPRQFLPSVMGLAAMTAS
ncbi:hypothetical protein PHYPSEUDO_009207 [Phytophthora pseudosyringae]|uniref:Uncharacterized protein n=1 Tax=Phytophthora pseudosyringae TaxID=221518 RepID=A0A8T1WEC2_9STRA|nr:hypothetical protein PHYPSEUDO_009207 [Phytophthora pseudosyringae]